MVSEERTDNLESQSSANVFRDFRVRRIFLCRVFFDSQLSWPRSIGPANLLEPPNVDFTTTNYRAVFRR